MAPRPCRVTSFQGSCEAGGAVGPPLPAGLGRSPSMGNRAIHCTTLSTAGRVGRRALAVYVRRGSRCPLSPRSSVTSSASRSGPTRAVVGRGLLPFRAGAPVGSSAPSIERSSAPWCTPCAASGAGVATAAWGPTKWRTGRSPAEQPSSSPDRRRGSRSPHGPQARSPECT